MHPRRQRFQQTIAALQSQFGPTAIRPARDLPRPRPPHLSTGFPALDALTGCDGIPLAAMTLLSGPATSGKLTLAYKTLAQRERGQPVALLDFAHSADPDYLARAGVDLATLLLVRPPIEPSAAHLLVDLVATRSFRLIVVNSLADLQSHLPTYRALTAVLGRLHNALRATQTALLWIDDPAPPWLRWLHLDPSTRVRRFVALHLEMSLERWLTHPDGHLTGYTAQATLLKSRWARPGRTASVDIVFNGVIKARSSW